MLLVVLIASLVLVLPSSSSDSDVAEGDVWMSSFEDLHSGPLTINAGASGKFSIVVTNSLSASDPESSRMVSIGFVSVPGVTVSSADLRDFTLKGQESRSVTATVDVDRYAGADDYKIEVTLGIKSLQPGSKMVEVKPLTVELVVLSSLSSGDSYNKILGMFDNPLPAPFNSPAATGIISFLLWMLIGAVALMIFVPYLIRLVTHNHKEEGPKLRKELRVLAPLVLFLFSLDNSLRIFGADEEIVGYLGRWFIILYIILGALIAWRIYLVLVRYTMSKVSNGNSLDRNDMDIGPLLRLFGKLVISVLSLTLIMSAMGFNLTAIVTSAGIVSLGITLGAQNILNQFFSGVVLLMTHPFRSGDLVRIGTATTVYKVSSVNLMSTTFENGESNEMVIMPNNMVSSSAIVNLTRDTPIYRIALFMKIAYGSDIDLARKLMMDVAMAHPNVVNSGTVNLPYTRISDLLDSSIEVRLTCYVYDFNSSGTITGQLREAVYKSFKENGITVPFPQMDVHMKPAHKDGIQNDTDD
jgi:small-conductance mechanosensitive channel